MILTIYGDFQVLLVESQHDSMKLFIALSSGLIPLHSTSFPIILGCDIVKSVMWKFCVKTILNFKYGKS